MNEEPRQPSVNSPDRLKSFSSSRLYRTLYLAGGRQCQLTDDQLDHFDLKANFSSR
jgi:hypothetical protein